MLDLLFEFNTYKDNGFEIKFDFTVKEPLVWWIDKLK